jgi:FkbH-like protein
LAVSATFTAEPVEATLAFWMRELGLDYQVKFAPYNQVFQQLLDPASLLARNQGGVNALLVRFEDWARFSASEGTSIEILEESVRHLVSCVRHAAESFTSPLIVCICPASNHAALAKEMESFVRSSLEGVNGVHLITPADLNSLYPVEQCHDPHADELGHVPYTPEFFAALGTMLSRKAHAIRVAPYKAIVLDCDDTLWQGICGEDGPEGVVIDPPRKWLEEFMVAQHDAGMLLCLASKNNEEDVLDTFQLHPEMPLRMQHFVARRINWEPKSHNLAALAEELELGLDSFILVDDNPKECDEVQANCPEVLTVPLPPEAEEFPLFLRHIWAFDHARVTAEDKRRTELYTQRIERSRLARQVSSLNEFLASLKLEVRISPMAPQQLPRVAQLTQRTNQMNLTAIRRTESEIQALVNSGRAECLTVEVSDRFGSYGLTGVIIFTEGNEALTVDTFLLSCRVLGRGVEHRMLARLGEIAVARGLTRVNVPFVPTQRNRPAQRFLESAGLPFRTVSERGIEYRFPAEGAANIAYKPEGGPPKAPAPFHDRPEARRYAIDYVRIARELRDPAEIVRRVREEGRNGAAAKVPYTAPRTELEGELAAIWAELLGVPSVGIQDNFFDLGGHSLLAVQLLSRVRQVFDIDLTLEVVYSGAFTVAELAKTIELQEIEQAGAEQYAEILKELEGLSDDEVRALLAEEENAAHGRSSH